MLLSHRATSPLNNLEKQNSISRNEERSRDRLKPSSKRAGSAIHRCLTRNRTESYLLGMRTKIDPSVKDTSRKYESQFSKYQNSGTQNPQKSQKLKKSSSSVNRISYYDSKNKVSTIQQTVDYNTTNPPHPSNPPKTPQTTVKVEYASSLGPSESTKVLITKWVDYSTKYGIGYKLSDG